MLTQSCFFLGLLLSLHHCVRASSVCVARLYSGDEFVNQGGVIEACAEYGATCAVGYELEGGVEVGLECGCNVSEFLVPCPACKCSTVYPEFNGKTCARGRATGWIFQDDLIDPHLNHSQVIAIDKRFPYPTKVHGWRMRMKNWRDEGGWLLFQVWRPKLGDFNLVAYTNFTYRSSRGFGYTDTELPLHDDEWIRVEPGDVIGIFLPNGVNTAAAPFAIGLLESGTVIDSSDTLFFTRANQDPPMELSIVNYDEHMAQFMINIQAIIGPPIEGEKQCLAQPMSVMTGDTTPTPKSDLPLDIEYIRLIVVPIIITLLFLILLALAVGITITCVRVCIYGRRKNANREEGGCMSLDTMERRSTNNIYPPLGSLPRCTSKTTGSCSESLYEAISDVIDRFTSSCSGSLPHTYAILECPPLYTNETHDNTVPHFQVQEGVQAQALDKSEKRLSTKDDLTGQESEEDTLSDVDVAEMPMKCGHTHEMEHQVQIEGVEEDMVDQEEVFGECQFDGDEDSDHDIQIYKV